ncbi:hypothetical protein KUTeg_023317 [Tegillarca granosa]|uniref:PiggyBac transposable element-derived protein 4 C-terminal zinc-finger domain-containing protein n=1 Tax=Tegillarca granosa TaxID=220873 RepID=A0ABQ9E1V9_TEGGR|nr:hypothetical protein KUTeg_023317 [Tegillarca granosa]
MYANDPQSYIMEEQQHVEHRLVRAYTSNGKKECAFCKYRKVKTKSGWRPNTHYKCIACDIPLCNERNERNCFELYHKMIYEGGVPLTGPKPRSYQQW